MVIQVRPWWEPQDIIPIAGMIAGNSMTSAALAGDRLQGDLRARAVLIEAMLALGFSGRDAVKPMVRAALRAAMIPTVNGMMTVGLVQLPGMMTGQILAALFAAGHPLSDRGGVHAGGGHGTGIADLRSPAGDPLSYPRPPAPALSAVMRRRAGPGLSAFAMLSTAFSRRASRSCPALPCPDFVS